MKISILLPYKENFSPEYAGAVSLFVKDTVKISKYKNKITVYGNTSYKKGFKINYKNLNLQKKFLNSTSKIYIKSFLDEELKNKSDIIEIHNRPLYVKPILEAIKTKIILYYHNDPLSMSGSVSNDDRMYLLKKCEHIIVISEWIKKRLLKNLQIDNTLMQKIHVIPHSTQKIESPNLINSKEKIIIFVGKLNSQKGYDIFGNVILRILNNNSSWKSIVIGDEEREKLIFNHPRLHIMGFIEHNKVIKLFEKSSIAVVPSRWQEPLGRTGLEASSRGCATIVSNRGGLPETITDGIILKKLNEKELFKQIQLLIDDKRLRKNLQKKSILNFKLDHGVIAKKIDFVRSKIKKNYYFNINKKSKLKILHITNFNQRYFGRLHFNTGTRINNGLIRLGHNILSLSDRDLINFSKSFTDYTGSKYLNDLVSKTINNFKPDLIILGHADKIKNEMLSDMKDKYKNLYIAQWFLDPLSRKGPDYEKNKSRILDKISSIDSTFITTDPNSLDFRINNSFYMPNPCDASLDYLQNFKEDPIFDIFYAISHGVHRGILRKGKSDEREIFVKKLLKNCENIKFDVFGMFKRQPVWGDEFITCLSNSKMGLNLSRGKPIKYYSSDRIAQLMGNGLLTFIDKQTKYDDFFKNDEMVFYNNIEDLSEKIKKYSKDLKNMKKIAKKGYFKYHKYFNSTLVAKYIIDKTIGNNSSFYWDK
jgi:glycosyltransferase involved in cell wall biosynthesis